VTNGNGSMTRADEQELINATAQKADYVTRRGWLKWAGAAGAAAVASGVAAHYVLPTTPFPSTETVTETSSTIVSSTEQLTTKTINPMVSYATEQGLNPEIISEISFLGEDGIDYKDETFVSYLLDIQKFDFPLYQQERQSSNEERTDMQENLVNIVLEDRAISDTEYYALQFLHYHPMPMQPRMAKYSLDQSALELIERGADKGVDPELLCELARLPDRKYDKEKHTEFFDNMIDISTDPRNKVGIETMLNEGLKYGRIFNALLQCEYWLWLDGRDIESSFRPFNPDGIIRIGWQGTTTSRNYKSDKWSSFEEVTDRLSSRRLCSKYMIDNISYVYEPRGHWQEPIETFNRKKGQCGDQASFAAYSLGKGLYDAYVLVAGEFSRRVTNTHAVCLSYDNPFYYTIQSYNGPFHTIDNGRERGPFTNKEAVARDIDKRSNWSYEGYELYNLDRGLVGSFIYS
jgi:hypothetical protein